jgi:type I restriction enzyme S subunit
MRKSWTETTLGEIAEVIGGGTPSTSVPEYWGNDVVWLTPTEIVENDGKTVSDSIRKLSYEGLASSGAQILPEGSVVLTSRASVGFVAISECELSTNQGFQSLVPGKNVLAYFLMYWIQNNRNEFESRAAGSTFKEISKKNVKSIKLYLPPLKEQKSIVDLISTVDSYIEALEQQSESARKSRSAVLHEMLSAGGDDWTETTLGEVAEINPRVRNLSSTDPFVPMDAVKADTRWVTYFEEKNSRGGIKAQGGDVLFARITPCLENGKISQVPYFIEACGGSTEFIVIRGTNDFDKDFAFFVCSSERVRKIAESLMTGTTGRQRVSSQDFASIPISLPPLPEQKRIVDLISSIDVGISATEKLMDETKQLRSGLLSDLLSGDHEIPENYDTIIGAA